MVETHDSATRSERTQRTGPRIRPLPMIIGAVLWVLVFVGLWVIWQSRQTDSAVTVDLTDSKPAATSDPSPVGPGRRTGPQTADGSQTATGVPPSRRDLQGDGEKDGGSSESPWDPEGIKDFELTERSGRTVSKEDLLGRPWVVCFVFTRCAGPCPKVSTQMRKLQDATEGSDVQLVTISVDPDYDTPEKLRKYAEVYRADRDRWLFLTGDQDEIYQLIQDSFKMPVMEMTGPDRKPGYEVLHTTNILHVDSQGRVLGKYNALKDSDMASLRRTLLADDKGSRPSSADDTSSTPEDQ